MKTYDDELQKEVNNYFRYNSVICIRYEFNKELLMHFMQSNMYTFKSNIWIMLAMLYDADHITKEQFITSLRGIHAKTHEDQEMILMSIHSILNKVLNINLDYFYEDRKTDNIF